MLQKKKTTVYRTDLLNVGLGQGQMPTPSYLYGVTLFNEEGVALSRSSYLPNGLLQERIDREYDPRGLLSKETYFSEDDVPSETILFERDDTGKSIREVKRYLDDSFDTTTCHYNEEGKLVERVTTDDDGETDQIERFWWNGEFPVRHQLIDSEGETIVEEEFAYNEGGQISEHRRIATETGENFMLKVQYDNEGRKSLETLHDEDGDLLTAIHYEYNDQGQLIASLEESAGMRNSVRYTYDTQGNPLGQEEVDEEGNRLSSVEHSYDNHGNLTGSVIFINGRGRAMSQHYELHYEYEWFDKN